MTPRTAPTSRPSSSFADRKSTRLNSSHVEISYAVLRLKKKTRLRSVELYADRQSPPPTSYLSKVAPPHAPGGDHTNDDNEWYGIELPRANHLFRRPTLA